MEGNSNKARSALGALNVAAEKSRREKSATLKNFAAQAAKVISHKDLDSIIRFQGGSHANANPEYQHQEWKDIIKN